LRCILVKVQIATDLLALRIVSYIAEQVENLIMLNQTFFRYVINRGIQRVKLIVL